MDSKVLLIIGLFAGLVLLAFIQRQVAPQDLSATSLPAAQDAPSIQSAAQLNAPREESLESLRVQPSALPYSAVDQSSTTQDPSMANPAAASGAGAGTVAAVQEVLKDLPGLSSQVALDAPGKKASCGEGPHIVELVTNQGVVRIRLLPDLSCSSVAYWQEAASKNCRGNFYRTEDYLLQGKLSCENNSIMVSKGDCPKDAIPELVNQKCLSENFCGCHGPVGTYGSFAWAGAGTGPDFFVQTRQSPGGDYWHTTFGQIVDEASWATISNLQNLPDKLGRKQIGFNYGPESFHTRIQGSSI